MDKPQKNEHILLQW